MVPNVNVSTQQGYREIQRTILRGLGTDTDEDADDMTVRVGAAAELADL